MKMPFKQSTPLTLGVELEIQLLEPTSLDLTPQGPLILGLLRPEEQERIKAEFIRSMLEVCTPICADISEVAQVLPSLCQRLEQLADQAGASCFASSLHPFALFKQRRISPGSRYDEIMTDLQLAGRRMITQALHVHVGLDNGADAIKVYDGIRVWLPLLLALSASSPYLEGEDTGFASYRTNLFGCLPRTGMPEELGSWQNFEQTITTLNHASLLNGIKELWWDVRPHPDFGTVEIRICDLPSRMADILALTALIQALVAWLLKEPRQPRVALEILKQSRWHACRYGLAGSWISAKQQRPFTELALDMVNNLKPMAQELGSWSYLEEIRRICEQGNSAMRQRLLNSQHGDLRAMMAIIQQEFWT